MPTGSPSVTHHEWLAAIAVWPALRHRLCPVTAHAMRAILPADGCGAANHSAIGELDPARQEPRGESGAAPRCFPPLAWWNPETYSKESPSAETGLRAGPK